MKNKKTLLIIGLVLVTILLVVLANFYEAPLLWLLAILAPSYTLKLVMPLLVDDNQQKVRRHFQKLTHIRLQLVEDLLNRKMSTPDDLTSQELVALFALSLAKSNNADTLKRMTELSSAESAKMFNEDFFSYLEYTIQTFHMKRINYRVLIGFSETTARHHQKPAWADKFRQLREQMLRRHVESIPLIRHRR